MKAKTKVKIEVANRITLTDPPKELVARLMEELVMENPKYKDNLKHRYSNHKTPAKLWFIKRSAKEDRTFFLPKGFCYRLAVITEELNLQPSVKFNEVNSPCPNIYSTDITLHKYQLKACERMLEESFGVLQAPTGSGKTVMAIKMIEAREQQTLIVVHTKELMYQWRDRFQELTDIIPESIGLIGDGHKEVGTITIGIINSLTRLDESLFTMFGMVVVDECHRVPSTVFTKFLVKLNCRYMLGLSATPFRRDGLSRVINFYMGETLHKISTKDLQDSGHIMKAKYVLIDTKFSRYVKDVAEYQDVITDLTEDWDRNWLIANQVLSQYVKEEGAVLVISDRKSHCWKLVDMMRELDLTYCVLTGDSPKKVREEVKEEMNSGRQRILIATGQLIGEGFDLKHLSSIFLCSPIKYNGRLIQYIGRILRTAEGKEEATVFDFDDPCWILQSSLGRRLKTYKELGIERRK